MTWIPIQELLNAIGPARASGIMYLHAFTGCDVVSACRGKGKKSAWHTWDVFDEVMEIFSKLSHFPTEVTDTDVKTLQRFVVLMYDRSSAATGVDEARLPTFAASNDHTTPFYQPKQLYGNMLSELPIKQASYWARLSPIALSCQEQTRCSCKKGCTRRCKSFVLNLPVQHSATARVNIRTVRKTTVF